MLPTCLFLTIVLVDSPVPATLVPSESIREIDPEVTYDDGEAVKLSAALLPVHLLKQHPFQLWKADPSLQYHQKVSDLSAW